MAGLGKIMVVCGPTATGKSSLAFGLARRFGGEVVGADSMQVYRGLVIGTAAVTPRQAGGVPQHLVGVVPPWQPFSVADWLGLAREAIAGIQKRGGLPVVCGGTGLYLKNLLDGVDYRPAPADGAARRLQEEWERLGGGEMWRRLQQADPERAGQLHPNDKKRVLRALLLYRQTGRTARQRDADTAGRGPAYSALCIGLNYADRGALYAAIDARVDGMLVQGLLEEARAVYQNRADYKTAAQAIGYKELFPFFEGAAPLEACVDKLKQATRNYAKRQLTWFGRMAGIKWLEAGQAGSLEKAACMAESFLQG